jgi:hypothetical protein
MKNTLRMDIHIVMVCHFSILLYVAYTSDDKPLNRQPNRKDIATTFTRKLVLNSVPSHILPDNYTAVTTVVVRAEPLIRSDSFDACKLSIFLGTITKGNTSSTYPHIVFDGLVFKSMAPFRRVLECLLETLVPATQEYLGVHRTQFWDFLGIAHHGRAVLHVPKMHDTYDGNLQSLGLKFISLIIHMKNEYSSGQVYLCGVPHLVLSPAELIAAGHESNDVAEIKIFQFMSKLSRKYPQPDITWDIFKSHIQFVSRLSTYAG